jgi:hypothetical protein
VEWRGKKKAGFILGCFYVILNVEVGRKSTLLPSLALDQGDLVDSYIHLCKFSGTLS